MTFEEIDGQTTMISHELYPSKEALEGAFCSGMEEGANETLDQLAELVAAIEEKLGKAA